MNRTPGLPAPTPIVLPHRSQPVTLLHFHLLLTPNELQHLTVILFITCTEACIFPVESHFFSGTASSNL